MIFGKEKVASEFMGKYSPKRTERSNCISFYILVSFLFSKMIWNKYKAHPSVSLSIPRWVRLNCLPGIGGQFLILEKCS